MADGLQRRTQDRSRQAAQIFGNITVDPIIDPTVEAMLQPVSRAPIDEEGPLVKLGWGIAEVAEPEVGNLFATLTLLNLPSGDVYVDQQVCRGKDERSSRADGHDQSRLLNTALLAGCPQALGIEEILDFPWMHPPENRIFGERRSELPLQDRRAT